MTSRIIICVTLLCSTAFGTTIDFYDVDSGDYRIERVLDIDGGDGYFYTVTPQRLTYEELQEFHVFDYPADVIRHQINLELDNLAIPLSLVQVEPEKAYWIDTPWTDRMDATYDVGFMGQCDSSGCRDDYLSLSGWEIDTIGASLGDSWTIEYPFMTVSRTFVSGHVSGDFDRNGIVDAYDIDQMQDVIWSGVYDPEYDFNHNFVLQGDDFDGWLVNVFFTSAGDANLDGLFNSADLIQLFAAGEYEDGIEDNSVWTAGDFNFDRDFTSSDLVRALEQGTYQSVNAVAVPEPCSLVLLLVGLMLTLSKRVRQ